MDQHIADLLGIDLDDPAVRRESAAVERDMRLIETLVRARKQLGLSQADVASRMERSQPLRLRLRARRWRSPSLHDPPVRPGHRSRGPPHGLRDGDRATRHSGALLAHSAHGGRQGGVIHGDTEQRDRRHGGQPDSQERMMQAFLLLCDSAHPTWPQGKSICSAPVGRYRTRRSTDDDRGLPPPVLGRSELAARVQP